MSETYVTMKEFEEYKKTMESSGKKGSKVEKTPKVEKEVKESVPRKQTAYQLFIKEQHPGFKQLHPEMKSNELMAGLAKLWNEKKLSSAPVQEAEAVKIE